MYPLCIRQIELATVIEQLWTRIGGDDLLSDIGHLNLSSAICHLSFIFRPYAEFRPSPTTSLARGRFSGFRCSQCGS